MAKLLPYIVIISLFLSAHGLHAQLLDSKGTINNNGTIKVKGLLQSKENSARIHNTGFLIIEGNAFINQDTLNGRVEFNRDDNVPYQFVPQLYYENVYFNGRTRKYLDTTFGRPFYALDTFNTAKETKLEILIGSQVNANGSVTHNGVINETQPYGKVVLSGQNPQNIDGRGEFKDLELDNTKGADVINSGGFRVGENLVLRRGDFRNDSLNNFIMGDSSNITRYVGASLAYEPGFDGAVSVSYLGDGSLTAGGELPNNPSNLVDMNVMNSGGLTLSHSVTVNRNLYLKSPINTEPNANDLYTLSVTSRFNPLFDGKDAEIIGSVRRTLLQTDSSLMLFNNAYTYAIFPDIVSACSLTELTFRVRPQTFPQKPGGDRKVMRLITVTGRDVSNNPVVSGLNMHMGYGWRVSADVNKNETNNLVIDRLLLQRWNSSRWLDHKNSSKPVVEKSSEWAHAFVPDVDALGDFAIGMPGGADVFLNARVFLEGPYRFGSMALDLNKKNLIPRQPPNIYPYNLDPMRSKISIASVPDSVVDWIVLEFKHSLSSSTKNYITCFVKSDGKIVDLDGRSRILLSNSSIDTGVYYVVIRHRNHLAVITADPVKIYPETADQYLDFSRPEFVLGAYNALKPVDIKDNSVLYAMFAGDVDGDLFVNERDRELSWMKNDTEGYNIFDINMSGIVNTRDLNYIWNNRGKTSFVP